jgi:hypothetical protein
MATIIMIEVETRIVYKDKAEDFSLTEITVEICPGMKHVRSHERRCRNS